ncbi:MAG: T9SS type A sorting domain-containing protein [Candidatus Cloacimonetes bacterium]|nr:T9SS type A sorting domain-containing protein [Candidatus Cloacimonadota bacterium]
MRKTFHNLKTVIFYITVCFIFTSTNTQAEWILVDSTSFTKLVPVEEKCYILVQSGINYLELTLPSDNLTPDAEDAIAIAPDWLKMDLRDNFRRLSENDQNLYAGLINNSVYPYVDEVCFEVAHIAPQTLSSSMNPQVLIENVESLYEMDNYFDYVTIVDYGGDDYYSTTMYLVLEEGIIHEFELPREIYYWYIVHPKLHKETPNYINPGTGNPAVPPIGKFWRDYLINHNDFGYPLLRTYLDTCSVLWKCEQNTINNGAVGAVTQWVQDVMTFQPYPHHNQPVRIYTLHIGTCSVYSYLTSAAARAALIPTVVNVMYSDNHKINEFWDRRWIAWEPVNTFIDYPEGYENWGWNIAAAFNWRGDSFIWDAIEKYTEVCTLNVNVFDSNGHPVDGARIKIYSSPCTGWGATAGWTNYNGQKQFLLGDNRTFSAQVTSAIGNYPVSGMETVIINSSAGVYYNWNVTLPGTLPILDVSPDTIPSNPTDDYRLVIEYNLPREILYGYNFDDNNCFSEPSSPGHIDFFICDEGNFNNYIANQSFHAFEIHQNNSGNNIDFILPSSDSWYAVFSNEDKLVMTQELQVTARLYQKSTSIIPEEEVKKLFPRIALYPNYPNPFCPETQITFYISSTGETELAIYNVSGQKVRTLINEFQTTGEHTIIWDGTDDDGNAVSSGIYFYRLTNNGKTVDIKKMLLLK